MIASGAEIRRGIEGALAILRGEADAMSRFDLTLDGFFKSFTAMLLAAPVYALLVIQRLERRPVALAPVLLVLLEGLGYVVGWLAFPIAAGLVLHLLRQGGRFVPLVVAVNWAAVLQVALLALASLAALFLPAGPGTVVTTVAVLSALFYQWLVIKTALEAPGGIAAGFLLLDVLVSLLVSGTTDRLELWLSDPAHSSSGG
ncbi:MAG: hypothetical protein N2038_06640 [Geminicoccaceae bacterium]|nr:hypothetical protein [Geminicoccaceae bacterium]MCX7629911.1 hypothetical protein [Geminicoccaceae bacterium]MDW8342383.1 hypothetical protein [Geminicoccaceae bacterium]